MARLLSLFIFAGLGVLQLSYNNIYQKPVSLLGKVTIGGVIVWLLAFEAWEMALSFRIITFGVIGFALLGYALYRRF